MGYIYTKWQPIPRAAVTWALFSSHPSWGGSAPAVIPLSCDKGNSPSTQPVHFTQSKSPKHKFPKRIQALFAPQVCISQALPGKKIWSPKVLPVLITTAQGTRNTWIWKLLTSLWERNKAKSFSHCTGSFVPWPWHRGEQLLPAPPKPFEELSLKLWMAAGTSDKSILARDGFGRFRRWCYQLE